MNASPLSGLQGNSLVMTQQPVASVLSATLGQVPIAPAGYNAELGALQLLGQMCAVGLGVELSPCELR